MKLSIFNLYKIISHFKHNLLISQFGFVVECKHSPTCSRYWQQQVKKQGWIRGTAQGLKRILTCW